MQNCIEPLKINEMEKTIGSLFDGIGGFPLAGSYYGFASLWASEIEPFPIHVTKERLSQMKHLGNITKINGAKIEPTTVICGGSPCQDLSVAGMRAGMAQKCSQCGKEFDIKEKITFCPDCGAEIEKTRSGLFMEQIRIVKEMRKADAKRGRTGKFIRPRFMVWENVPGAFSSHNGEDFRIVLEETCRIIDSTIHISRPSEGWPPVGTIVGNGFSLAWRVLDAQYWGVPQRRRRIFLIADFAGYSASKILFKCESMSRNPAQGRAARQGITTDVERSTEETGECSVIPINDQATHENGYSNGSMVGLESDPMYSLTATDRHAVAISAGFKGQAGSKAGNIGFEEELSPTLQAVQPSHVVCLQGSMIGRSDKNGPQGDGINEDVSFTLNTSDRHAICYDARGNGDGSTVATLTGDHQRRISDYTSFAVLPFDTTQCTSPQNGNNPHYEDPCHPLASTAHPPAIVETYQKVTGTLSPGAHPGGYNGQDASNDMLVVSKEFKMYENSRHSEYKEGCGTLKGSGGDTGGGGENLIIAGIDCRNGRENGDLCGTLQAKPNGGFSYNCIHPVRIGYAVRRLTPLECERLQGYPDGWTDIPGASDSARYKALGNSVAIPCVAYIMRGIAEELNGGLRKKLEHENRINGC